MRIVSGFACGFKNELGTTFLFGPNVNLRFRGARRESLYSNGLELFPRLVGASKALAKQEGYVVRLHFEIAENMDDIEVLGSKKRANFLVMMKLEGNQLDFLGRQTNKKRAYPLPGAYTSQNGWSPFRDFGAARYAASEAVRQGRCYATIVAFKIKRL